MKKLLAVVSIVITGLLLAGQTLFAQAKAEVKMEWLSHSHFRFTSPNGKILLTNPHLDNADNKTKLEEITKADVIVVADGHGDEIGKAPEIALKTGAKIVAVRELAVGYLKSVGKVPDNQLVGAGIGDRHNFDGITVRVVHSIHGSGTRDPTAPYGGPAAGFIITFENGYTVYFTGSTAIHSDMALYASCISRIWRSSFLQAIATREMPPRWCAYCLLIIQT